MAGHKVNFIVHSESLEKGKYSDSPHSDQFEPHLAVVRDVRKQPNTIELKDGQFPGDFSGIQEGDDVSIYGLWADSCVTLTIAFIQAKGANVSFGPESYSVLPWPPNPLPK